MPDDKKKQLQKLQALAAKRKADSEGHGGQKKLKAAPAASVIPPKKLSLNNGDTKPPRPSAISKGKEKQQSTNLKAKSPVKRKPTEKWDSDSDTSEEDNEGDASAGSEDDLDSEEASEEEADHPHPAKKSGKIAAAKSPAKKFKPSDFKEKDKGKRVEIGKDNKGKGKRTVEESDDDGDNLDEEDDGGDLSEDPLDEVDPSNILPSRTRRRASQPVQYDFDHGSGDDSEDDSDA
ncbi:unnamed protein product [Sphagnum jensenii]|uniref:Histone chaperone domain-containing protein n=1 Tax=Sphagnum jensenii TaxID=128206 RepID=A0ABP0W752_9BRYO